MCRWWTCVCLLGLIQSPVVAAWFISTPDKIETEHTLYYVGENITLHCFKETSSFDDGARFTAGNERVPHQYVTVVNDTYIRMDRPATAEDEKSITFTCADNNTPFIAAQVISTEYRPREVEKLIPVFYDRRTALFSWGLGVEVYKYRSDTQNPNNPTTVITADYNTNGANWTECLPVQGTSPETSCQVENFMAGAIPIELRVRVENKKRGDVVNTIFSKIHMKDYEKPKAVEKLTVNALNSTCVTLAWKMDRSELHAVIKYEHSFSNQSKEVPEDGNNTMICNLHPTYSYRFEVRAVPRHGYPSEPVNMAFKMPEAAPSSGPRVSNGGYNRSLCSVNGRQDLFIFFQPVVEEDQNGQIISYTAVCEAYGLAHMDSQPPRDFPYFKVPIPCGSGVDVKLYANTSAGQSPPSYLYIPSLAEVNELSIKVRALDLMVELQNLTQVIAHWKPPVLPHNYSLFLCYCPQTQCRADECKFPLEYVELNVTQGMFVLNSTDTQFDHGRYGLAAVDLDDRRTEIAFTDCVYNAAAPDPAPSPPIVTQEGNSITLTWQARRCDGQRVVLGYVIRACPSDRMHECNDIYVDAKDEPDYQWKTVADDNVNTFHLAANTTSGLTEFSEPAYGKPIAYRLTPSEIAAITVCVLVVVLLLVCLVSFSVRSYCRQVRDFMDIKVKMPTVKVSRNSGRPVVPEWNPNLNTNRFVDADTCTQEPQVKVTLKARSRARGTRRATAAHDTDRGYGRRGTLTSLTQSWQRPLASVVRPSLCAQNPTSCVDTLLGVQQWRTCSARATRPNAAEGGPPGRRWRPRRQAVEAAERRGEVKRKEGPKAKEGCSDSGRGTTSLVSPEEIQSSDEAACLRSVDGRVECLTHQTSGVSDDSERDAMVTDVTVRCVHVPHSLPHVSVQNEDSDSLVAFYAGEGGSEVSRAEGGGGSYVWSTKTCTLQSGYVASNKVQEGARRETATDETRMSVVPPGSERDHTSLEHPSDSAASSLQKVNMAAAYADPTSTKNDNKSKGVGEKTLEKDVGNEDTICSALSPATTPHNQQVTAAYSVKNSPKLQEKTTHPNTSYLAVNCQDIETSGSPADFPEIPTHGSAANCPEIPSPGFPDCPEIPTPGSPADCPEIPAPGSPGDCPEIPTPGSPADCPKLPSPGSPADCPEIPTPGSPADCSEIPSPGSPTNCPEIPSPGSPADCPEIPTHGSPADCPEILSPGSPAKCPEIPSSGSPVDCLEIPAPGSPGDCPEISSSGSPEDCLEIPSPESPAECPEIPTYESPAEIPVLESTTEVSHPPRQTGYIEKHHADGDTAMKIENAESSMSPTHIPATGMYPATRLTHKPEEAGIVNDEKIETDNLCEKNAFLKNGKVKCLDSGYDDDCGDNGGKLWSDGWSPTKESLPENGEEGNLMLDLVAESRSHAPGYVVIPMKQITPSV